MVNPSVLPMCSSHVFGQVYFSSAFLMCICPCVVPMCICLGVFVMDLISEEIVNCITQCTSARLDLPTYLEVVFINLANK